MEGSGEPDHLEGEGFHPIIGRIPEDNGQIDLPITFEDPFNYRMETLTFEVVGFPGTFHAILGCHDMQSSWPSPTIHTSS